MAQAADMMAERSKAPSEAMNLDADSNHNPCRVCHNLIVVMRHIKGAVNT